MIRARLFRGWPAEDALAENPDRAHFKIPMDEIIGHKFGRLTVTRLTDERNARGRLFECQCECGNIVRRNIDSLARGNTKSCGCLKKDAKWQNNRVRDVKLFRCGECT